FRDAAEVVVGEREGVAAAAALAGEPSGVVVKLLEVGGGALVRRGRMGVAALVEPVQAVVLIRRAEVARVGQRRDLAVRRVGVGGGLLRERGAVGRPHRRDLAGGIVLV